MIRFREFASIALNVSDLSRARNWYENMVGLQFNGTSSDGGLFFRICGDHHSVVLYQSDKPGLKRIGWELESAEQMNALATQLDRNRVTWRELTKAECRDLHVSAAIRMIEPFTGAIHDFYASSIEQMPTPYMPSIVQMRHLGHVVLGTPRYRAAIDFYENVLNFRTSDEIDGRINLMRCFPNPYHHSFGIASSERDMLHHVNFMVTDAEDLEKAQARFDANHVPVVWKGLHPPSGNTFLFFIDPDGLSIEYGYGMELFAEIGAREHRVFPAKAESFDSTGARRDARMAAQGHIETAALM